MKTTEPSEGSGEFYRNTTKIPPPPLTVPQRI